MTGTAITWTATPCGGYPPTTQLALFRRRAGTTAWILTPRPRPGSRATSSPGLRAPPTRAPGRSMLWARDDDTPPSPGYGATYNPGNVQVVAPLTLTAAASPASARPWQRLTWTATASGGDPGDHPVRVLPPPRRDHRLDSGRHRPGLAGQQRPQLDADLGGHRHLGDLRLGQGRQHAGQHEHLRLRRRPPTRAGPGCAVPSPSPAPSSPSAVYYGRHPSWTATASGGVPSTRQYAFFRRRAGTTRLDSRTLSSGLAG